MHDGAPCPGAPWQGMAYASQLEHKHAQVDEALRRLGRLDGFELEPIEPAVAEWRYRNKLEYSFGERPGELLLGFHRRGSWSEIVNVEDCHLASEANNAARNAVREWGHRQGLDAHDSRAETGVLRNLVVREGRRTGQIQTRLVTAPGEIPRPPVDLHTVIEGPSGGTDGPTGVLGAEYLAEEVCGLRLRLSHSAFLQTNTEMAERLYGIVSRAGRAHRQRAPLRPLLRDRHDRARAGPRRRRGLGPRGGRGRGRRRRAQRRPRTGSRTRASCAPTPGSASRRCSTRRAARTWSSSTRRDRACRRRCPQAARVRGAADRLRLLQPDDAGAQRGSDRRGGLYAAAREAGRHVPADAARRVRRDLRAVMSRGFGVAAGLDPEVAAPLAARCAELGYASMWSNDHPGALGLETLKVFADAAPALELGVAVMALDRHRARGHQRPHRPARDRARSALARRGRRLLRRSR